MSAACLSKFQKFLKLSNKRHMGSFYAPNCKTDCLQILCKFSKNWISVPDIVHQLTLSLRCKYCKSYSRSIFPDAINNIRHWPRAVAAERLQANDVSLLWRHLSRVRSRTLERTYRRPFLTVIGEFEPQNVVGHRVDPKKGTSLRHNACFKTSRVKVHARVASVGESGGKNKNKKRGLIFYVFRQALPYGRFAQILGYVFVLWT